MVVSSHLTLEVIQNGSFRPLNNPHDLRPWIITGTPNAVEYMEYILTDVNGGVHLMDSVVFFADATANQTGLVRQKWNYSCDPLDPAMALDAGVYFCVSP